MQKIKIIESSVLEIPLTRQLLFFCTKNFSERNPVFDDPYADKKNIKEPEIYQGYKVNYIKNCIEVKKGLKAKLTQYLYKANIEYEIIDETNKPLGDFWFQFPEPTWKLRSWQELGKIAFLKRGIGIISFDCGMGKTILGLNLVGHFQYKTIILVHTKTLLQQWIKEIKELIHGNYSIGIIGDSQIRFGDITVALFQAFENLLGSKEVFNSFGMVIVDECHHIPANTFYNIIGRFNAKVLLGLSATLARKDRKEFLTSYVLGDCLYQARRKDANMQQKVFVRRMVEIPQITKIIDKKTKQLREKKVKLYTFMGGRKVPNWSDAIGGICLLDKRTKQIVHDALSCVARGRKVLILSDRVEHCKQMYSLLQPFCKAKLAIGGDSDGLETYKKNPDMLDILVGTKVADEGLDIPSLDTLFLTCPLSLTDVKGDENTAILDQRVGRIARVYDGKDSIEVYVYVDVMISYFNDSWLAIISYLEREGFIVRNVN